MYLSCKFEVKAVSDSGRIEGYGAVFNNVDLGLDRIEPGAFSDFVKSTDSIPMLLFHDDREPVGLWDTLQEDKKGLYVAGNLNLSKDSGAPDVPAAWKARTLAKQGALTGLSIGYQALDYRYEEEVRVLEKLDVFEVSMTPFPMNPKAQVTSVKEIALMSQTESVRYLRQRLGISRKAADMLYHEGWAAYRDSLEYAREAARHESDEQKPSFIEDAQKWLRTIETLTTPR